MEFKVKEKQKIVNHEKERKHNEYLPIDESSF
jgi:hypothetical protein